jgi:hypothetical protein
VFERRWRTIEQGITDSTGWGGVAAILTPGGDTSLTGKKGRPSVIKPVDTLMFAFKGSLSRGK